jgi:two-component system, sensor histidine kinase
LQLAPCDECVHSDSALVEQILKNLLSNAIKYTAAGGSVSLRARRDVDAVRVDVIDTGVGIAPNQIAYIYDEFYQIGVPANSSREGYGLGLSIVQRLVRLLNLRLEVTSEVGQGSVFSLLLPCGRSQRAIAQPPAVSAATAHELPVARRPRVLLVEDDAGVRDATRILLSVEGYRVRAVASGEEALRSAHEEGAPDLLITDYHLGDGELGTHVIAALRDELHAEVRAVLVTGDTSDVVKHLPNDPRLRIASKPIDAEQLLSVLKDLLNA